MFVFIIITIIAIKLGCIPVSPLGMPRHVSRTSTAAGAPDPLQQGSRVRIISISIVIRLPISTTDPATACHNHKSANFDGRPHPTR